ncbi:hypothetical protein SODALDRAFT_91771 [Sodiomyces alkalinus F11]|uniref:Serine/arginine repetitive matrix protein 1 n=1 Tax=Sodiomyces alkalinus (strain CBS 110278 / VKM F-3762 / F11) TaxID=1314773 RepID=A0A3N2Q0H5_SODAK|nr:hypothetical protein SODALDRAFT_91771 [Sodiomyces alkalinus F11]ROT40242.1 hypothetical protein SODALDRAFT_91771 [Sodiomyces alkalinus F11]
MDRRNRFEDGEVTRYGAGESWRPFPRDRSPRRPRTPPRDRDRDRDREWDRDRNIRDRDRVRERERPRSPPLVSDSYVPGRSPPRRRSRSFDRFRRERSRGGGADTWRRRDRSRSLPRRPSPPRRSPVGRRTPLGRSPAIRDERPDRPRSPRRDRDRLFDPRDNRRRSRSPFGNRDRGFPERPSPRRSPVPRPGFRPRSRSPNRRGGENYQPAPYMRRHSPLPPVPKDIILPARPASRRTSPYPIHPPRPRSRPASRAVSPVQNNTPVPLSIKRETPKPARQEQPAAGGAKSPPRGPAALRVPPTGPGQASRNFTAPAAAPSAQTLQTLQTLQATPATQTPRQQQPSSTQPPRSDASSPTVPPAGPRGYVPPRGGGFGARGGRGGWPSGGPTRHASISSPSPSTPGPNPTTNTIPTGPRAGSSGPLPPTPSAVPPKPFNPPTGPAAQLPSAVAPARPTLAQTLIATLPPIIPGGKLDPASLPSSLGVTRDLEPHYRKLKVEEEKLRVELDAKHDRLRQCVAVWDKLELESKAWKTKVDLNEQSVKGAPGGELGGAAF